MMKWWMLGLAAVSGPRGCDSGKHETSAPHASFVIEVAGAQTDELPAGAFADGWAIHYDQFRLAPTFGLDDSTDHRKNDGYMPLVGEYYFGGQLLELTDTATRTEVDGWVVAGRSPGFGMHLRRWVHESDQVPAEASLRVGGTATGPSGEVLRFDWGFVTELTFARCVPAGSDSLLLPDGGSLTVHVTIDGAALFGDRTIPNSKLHFEPFAEADADRDGVITAVELRAVPVSEPGVANLFELLNARLAQLIAPDFTCEVSTDICQDRRATFGACDGTDLADKDFDGDTERNCVDDDIDGDQVANAVDCDPYTVLSALSHCDGSDRSEKDSDGDGIRNCQDPDIDGDDIPNQNDGRPYDNCYVGAQEK